MGFTPLVPVALLGFVPLGMLLFLFLPARRSVIAIYILGWLFLPPGVTYPVPGLPDYNKYVAINFAALFGVVLFDAARMLRFRLQWYDLPALVFLITPFFTSLVNGLGVNDALSMVYRQVTVWIIPYFLGRLYFTDLAVVRELAIGIFIGGLIYMPLTWIEMRLSPQLNRWVYGFHPTAFGMTRRFGGWRPQVFMQHGLMLAIFMCSATLVGMVLWLSGSLKRFLAVPMWIWTGLLGATCIMCRSFGAVVLMLVAMVIAYVGKTLRWRALAAGFIILPIVYMGVRGTDLWDGQELVDLSRAIGGEQRAGSLFVRLRNETAFVDHAMRQPLLGWGGHGRSRPDFADTGFRVLSDGYWIIVLGQNGLIGLGSMILFFTLPGLLFLHRWRSAAVWHPWLAPGMALLLITAMFLADCLFNAMLTPIFGLTAGALATLMPTAQVWQLMRQGVAAPARAGVTRVVQRSQPAAPGIDPGAGATAVGPMP